MSSLTYSSGALSTLPLFHRKKYVVYVEGDDDVLFWGILFRRFGLPDFHIKIAGGSSELDKYIRSVVVDNAAVVVARDCDYTDLKKTQVRHARVLYTYGYSVENSIYCPRNISNTISVFSKSLDTFEEEVEIWLNGFVKSFEGLLLLDITNDLSGKGFQVLGQSCGRFLASNASHDTDRATIKAFASAVRKNFKPREISAARLAINNSSKDPFYIVRGHFLSLGILNFVRNTIQSYSGKRPSLSYEGLHAMLVSHFETACVSGKDLTFLKRKINRLKKL